MIFLPSHSVLQPLLQPEPSLKNTIRKNGALNTTAKPKLHSRTRRGPTALLPPTPSIWLWEKMGWEPRPSALLFVTDGKAGGHCADLGKTRRPEILHPPE